MLSFFNSCSLGIINSDWAITVMLKPKTMDRVKIILKMCRVYIRNLPDVVVIEMGIHVVMGVLKHEKIPLANERKFPGVWKEIFYTTFGNHHTVMKP